MERNNNGFENILLAGTLVVPAWPAAIVAGIWYGTISVLRLSPMIVAAISGVVVIPILLYWQSLAYLVGWTYLFFGIENTFFPGVPTWPKVILISTAVGLAAGGVLHLLRQPNTLEMMKKPVQESRLKSILNKTKAEIVGKKHEKRPPAGVYLGLDEKIKPVVIGDSELNQHSFLVGTTGSGKTTTLKNYIQYALKNGFSIVIVDGKGEWGYTQEIQAMVEAQGRDMRLFSLNHPDQSNHYNPLAIGNPTELKDRLVGCFDWTEPHYFLGASRYLQLALQILGATGQTIDLPMLVRNLAPTQIQGIARRVGAPPEMISGLEEIDEKTIMGICSRLALIAESSIGDLLESDGRGINLLNTIECGGVAMFSLDKLAYPAFARQLGIMIVNDLKAAAAQSGGHKTMLIFDEFNTFASPQVVDLVNAARSFGFCVVMATQSLADLDTVDTSLRRQIVGNVNSLIVQRQNDAQDAELLASTIGTRDTIQLTRQIQDNTETELGSLRETKEFLVHPDQIKRLKTGEAIVLRKYPEFRVHHIRQIRNV